MGEKYLSALLSNRELTFVAQKMERKKRKSVLLYKLLPTKKFVLCPELGFVQS